MAASDIFELGIPCLADQFGMQYCVIGNHPSHVDIDMVLPIPETMSASLAN